MIHPYQLHLNSNADLVTTYEATRAGFVELALERNRRASPVIDQARSLKAAVAQITRPTALSSIPDIRQALLAAAGVSEKASRHLNTEDEDEAIRGLIVEYLEPAGEAFVEELIYRFLLTKGDAIGGIMRNAGGEIGQRKFTRAVLAALRLQKIRCSVLPKNGKWIDDDPEFDSRIQAIAWQHNNRNRTLLYNRMIPVVRKSVDINLLKCQPENLTEAIQKPVLYLGLGELKGGIDPAGADEHWKTARSALQRIRTEFSAQDLAPHTFFVGAAIVKSMSNEIWSMLTNGTLENAANLTSPDQVASLCHWLISL
jgi:type II restriction enzyme